VDSRELEVPLKQLDGDHLIDFAIDTLGKPDLADATLAQQLCRLKRPAPVR
jgi:hypothetical protein